MKKYLIIVFLFLCRFDLFADELPDSLNVNHTIKSPTVATIKSVILPGWGQYYVESYYKSAIFLGAELTFVYFLIDNHSKYSDAKAEFEAAKANGEDSYLISRLELNMKTHHNNRDQTAFYMLGIHVLSAIDAYVGAHLFEFDVTDEIKLFHLPNQYGLPSLHLRIDF
jgi:hypothetical protein